MSNELAQLVGDFKEKLKKFRAVLEEKQDHLDDMEDKRNDYLTAPEPKEVTLQRCNDDIDSMAQEFEPIISGYIRDQATYLSRVELNEGQVLRPSIYNAITKGGIGNVRIKESAVVWFFSEFIKGRLKEYAMGMDWPGAFTDGVTAGERKKQLATLDKEISAVRAEIQSMKTEVESAGGRFRD